MRRRTFLVAIVDTKPRVHVRIDQFIANQLDVTHRSYKHILIPRIKIADDAPPFMHA